MPVISAAPIGASWQRSRRAARRRSEATSNAARSAASFVSYNSCRDRHCPKCQGSARAAWLAERQAELLPVPYFHVVFTLPAPAAEIAFQNKAAVYAILFRTAAETLSTIAADNPHAARARVLFPIAQAASRGLAQPGFNEVAPCVPSSTTGAQQPRRNLSDIKIKTGRRKPQESSLRRNDAKVAQPGNAASTRTPADI